MEKEGVHDADDGKSPDPPTKGSFIEWRGDEEIDRDVKEYQGGYEGEQLKKIAENTEKKDD